MTTFPLLHWAPASASDASYPGLKEFLERRGSEITATERAVLARLRIEMECSEHLDDLFWEQVLEAVRGALGALDAPADPR